MYESRIDAIEEWADTAIDAYNDYIDIVKEALDAERDLYEFKKDIQNQTKDIAELERKIAALSGSDNKADIAERRKLEAQLYDAKEGLSDTYYDNAKSAQDEALDRESEAYSKSLENYIEKLRDTLDEATANMELFMQSVTNSVMLNAEIVRDEYTNTGVALDEALVTPWDEAIKQIEKFEGDGLSMMNAWTTDEGFFGKFESGATDMLTSPWSAGTTAAEAFQDSIKRAMENIYSNVESNVVDSIEELQKLAIEISKINDTNIKPSDSTQTKTTIQEQPKQEQPKQEQPKQPTVKMVPAGYADTVSVLTFSSNSKDKIEEIDGVKYAYDSDKNRYYKLSDGRLSGSSSRHASYTFDKKSTPVYKKQYYAKGTLGTKKDQWAITDEPQFGDELVLMPGKNGNLSYMRKGTSVVPASITKELLKLADIGVDGLTMPKFDSGINLMSNYVNKPELNIAFDSLVHVDHCDEGTIKDLEKMVDTKINDFTRKLNYSIKKFS